MARMFGWSKRKSLNSFAGKTKTDIENWLYKITNTGESIEVTKIDTKCYHYVFGMLIEDDESPPSTLNRPKEVHPYLSSCGEPPTIYQL